MGGNPPSLRLAIKAPAWVTDVHPMSRANPQSPSASSDPAASASPGIPATTGGPSGYPAGSRADGPTVEQLATQPLPRGLKRFMALLCCGGAVLALGAIVQPAPSSARSAPQAAAVYPEVPASTFNLALAQRGLTTPAQPTASGSSLGKAPPTDSQGRQLLGALDGSNYQLWIYAGTDGAVYTLADTNGYVLAEGMTPNDLTRRFPSVDLRGLQAGQGTKLMLAPEPAPQH